MQKAARILGAIEGRRAAIESARLLRRHEREGTAASRRTGPPGWREPGRWLKVWWLATAMDWRLARRAGREAALGNSPRKWTCERGTRGCTELHLHVHSRRPWDRLHDDCRPLYEVGMKNLADV